MIIETAREYVRHMTAGCLELTYRLFEEEFGGRTAFSISVSMTDNESGECDSCTARDITGDVSEALHMFKLISDGTVTPMTLIDIISDLLP